MTAMQLADRRPPVALTRAVVAVRLCVWMAAGAVLVAGGGVAVLGAALGGLGFVLCLTLWAGMRRWVAEAPSEEKLRFRRLFTWPASITLFLLEVFVVLTFLRFVASVVLGTPGLAASD